MIKTVIFQLKKYAPQILLATGIASMVGGTVAGCVASTKLSDKLAEGEKAVQAAKTEKDKKKAKRKTVVEIGKMYLPTVAAEAFGVGCLMGSNGMMLRREAGWIAAYKVMEKAYNSTRQKLMSGGYYEKVTDGEDGQEATVEGEKIMVRPAGYTGLGPFDEYFDCQNRLWSEDPKYTILALKNAQNDLNILLKREGHVFLNDVRRRCGFADTPTGQKVGWIYDARDPENHSNFIDLGISDIFNNPTHPFLMGIDEGFVLRFNPDGVIWDKI